MNYTVIIPKPLQKQLDKLPESVYCRVIEQIMLLEDNPRPLGAVKLQSYNNQYRIRIGDYRIRYEIEEQKLVIILIRCQHRKDVYRK